MISLLADYFLVGWEIFVNTARYTRFRQIEEIKILYILMVNEQGLQRNDNKGQSVHTVSRSLDSFHIVTYYMGQDFLN